MSLTIDGKSADERLNFASENHIPPYAWVPPEWVAGEDPPLKPTNNPRPDSTGRVAKKKDLSCPAISKPENQARFEKANFEVIPGEEQITQAKPEVQKYPHPCSDFEHVDPTAGSTEAFELLERQFTEPTRFRGQEQ